jgi:hypothetical protein
MNTRIKKLLFGTGVTVLALMVSVSVYASHGGSVHPDMVDEILAPGGSHDVAKKVRTPSIPADPEICFLADTTGSMGPAIANVQANAVNIMNTVLASQPSAEFCAAQYRDIGDTPLFSVDQALTTNTGSVATAINGWSAGGGGDTPEGQVNALFQLANSAAGYNGPNRILVWFGDASGHDPSNGHSLATAITDLQNAGITVIAVPVVSGFGDGLDATGQATAVANATGGQVLPGATPAQLSDAIIAGLEGLTTDVWWEIDPASCDAGLSVILNPAAHFNVPGGTTVNFAETITVDPDAPEGTSLHCEVTFIANSYPDGGAEIGRERIWITVPDVTPPVAQCEETVNPDGKNVPKAPAKGGQGQNQDGFYMVHGRDAVDPNVSISVVDMGADNVLGTGDDTSFAVADGDRIKYTEANGATPSMAPMGGNNGNGSGSAEAVDWKIKGQGDAAVVATDVAGNSSSAVCLVPNPPK